LPPISFRSAARTAWAAAVQSLIPSGGLGDREHEPAATGGELEEAEAVALAISRPMCRSTALADVAKARADRRDFDHALSIATEITERMS
jgi:hypothetical protein